MDEANRMSYSRKTIVKNAGVMMASQLITWSLALLLTFFLPRYLGAEAVGKFYLASSIWALFSIVISFGMDTLLTKEISREPERVNELLSTTLFARLLLFVASFAGMLLFVQSAGYSSETLEVAVIMAFTTLSWQMTGAISAALQGLERMEYISLSDIAGKFVVTVVSIAALLMGYKVVVVAWIHVCSAVVSLLIQVYGLQQIAAFKLQIKPHQLFWMLKSSLPFVLVSGFLVVYNQIDVIIISMLLNEVQVGLYSAASRLFGTFLFVPTVLITALFPVFSRVHKEEPGALTGLLARSLDFSLLLGVPIGLGIFAIADPLMVLLFGAEFAQAGPVLAVMGFVIICTYLNTVLGKYYVSTDRQNLWTWIMGMMVVLTIPLDLVLVPYFHARSGVGALGGAYSYLVTEGLMMLAGLFFLPKGMLAWKDAWYALRVLLAGAVMAGAAWLLRDQLIVLPVLAGAAVYAILLLVLGLVNQSDLKIARTQAARLLSRISGKKLEMV